MSEQLETPTIKLLEGARRYVLTHMVWFGDTTFTEPMTSDLGQLIINLIDDEINRLRKPCGWCEGDVSKYFDVNWYDFTANNTGARPKAKFCPFCGRPMDMSGLRDRSKGAKMTETMVRFNLVGGLVYTLTGDEAVKVFKEYEYSIPDACIFNHDGKTVVINTDHIVSVEWRWVKNE